MTLNEAVRVARLALFSHASKQELTPKNMSDAYQVLADWHATLRACEKLVNLHNLNNPKG